MPLSSTSSTADPFERLIRSETLPPGGVNLSAFEITLSNS